MGTLLDKLLKSGKKNTSLLRDSEIFNNKDCTSIAVPVLNIALSGDLDGGLKAGITQIAGPSKHFKSLLALILVKSFMDKHPDSVCIFFDSEFGITPDYIKSIGVDDTRIIHEPIENIEDLKFKMVQRLGEISREDKVVFFIDSVGNLASVKEVEDAEEEKSVQDMTRAKQFNSLWRIVTPSITMRDIPCIAINRSYQTQELYSKAVLSGGTGMMYSADTVFMIGKSQEKEGTEIVGWNFTINIEKSRFVREKSKIPFLVTYEGGLNKWGGLLELALEYGAVIKPSNGWYQKVDKSTGELIGGKLREKDTATKEFMEPIINDPGFKEFIKQTYLVASNTMIKNDEQSEEL
jgi:RecA/RadA recombinase